MTLTKDDIREILRSRMNAPPAPPLKRLRRFLGIYFSDADGLDDARQHMARDIAARPKALSSDLAAIEEVLADPPSAGVLAEMVAWDANWPLDDPSDEGAKAWLREIAVLIRELKGDEQPQL